MNMPTVKQKKWKIMTYHVNIPDLSNTLEKQKSKIFHET